MHSPKSWKTTRIPSRYITCITTSARIHKTLRVTPAMAAGVTDKVWDVKDIVAVLEVWERQQEYQKIAAR